MSMRYPGGLIATSPVNARYPSGVWTQAQAAPYQAQNVWTRDQFWPYTTLLLQGDGAVNGAQNNTFLDSSSNNFTITRNGNTTQGSFTPYEQDGYWSNYFDGSGDYLTVADNTALQMSGDFTWEAWVFPISNPSGGNYKTLWAQRANSGGFGGPAVVFDSAGNYLLFISNAAASNWSVSGFSTGLTITLNSWQHIALVKSGTTVTLYKNGVAGASTTHSTAVGTSGSLSIMAGAADGSQTVDGYMSNFRIVKGTAVYTSNFTPSASPLTAITNTSLLTCQSNRFKDNSTNNFTLTVNGNTSVQAFQPFPGATTYSGTVLGGSGYFDGSGDFLSIADNDALDFGTGNFTIEFWFNLAVSQDSTAASGFTTSGVVSGWGVAVSNTGVDLTTAVNDSYVTASQSSTIPNNTWNHFAAVRNGSTVTVYLNGVGGTPVTNTQSVNTQSSGMMIGRSTYNPNPRPFQGYVANFRILKGVAQYTANFTPPTTPVTAITNTSLLLNFTNAGIYDNSMMNNLETVGNAQVSTSVVKYGTGSMAFDGSGDWLVTPISPNLQLGGGDFTIEFWVNGNSYSVTDILGSWYQGAYSYIIQINGSQVQLYNGLSTAYTFSGTFNTGTWYHVALCRSGSSLRCFQNGTQIGSTQTVSGSWPTATRPLYIAYNEDNSRFGVSSGFNGYIDDLRITKGAARYITNFTPPPARMPGQ